MAGVLGKCAVGTNRSARCLSDFEVVGLVIGFIVTAVIIVMAVAFMVVVFIVVIATPIVRSRAVCEL